MTLRLFMYKFIALTVANDKLLILFSESYFFMMLFLLPDIISHLLK